MLVHPLSSPFRSEPRVTSETGEAITKRGETALMWAAMQQQLQCVQVPFLPSAPPPPVLGQERLREWPRRYHGQGDGQGYVSICSQNVHVPGYVRKSTLRG